MHKSNQLIYSQSINQSQEWIWEKLIDVTCWSEWDKDVISSELDQQFSVGAKGHLIDINGNRSDFEITQIDLLNSYSNRYDLHDDNALHFTHQITKQNQSPSIVTFTAWFQGPDAVELASKEFANIEQTMRNALSLLAKLKPSLTDSMP